jgi:hypothetical protein
MAHGQDQRRDSCFDRSRERSAQMTVKRRANKGATARHIKCVCGNPCSKRAAGPDPKRRRHNSRSVRRRRSRRAPTRPSMTTTISKTERCDPRRGARLRQLSRLGILLSSNQVSSGSTRILKIAVQRLAPEFRSGGAENAEIFRLETELRGWGGRIRTSASASIVCRRSHRGQNSCDRLRW